MVGEDGYLTNSQVLEQQQQKSKKREKTSKESSSPLKESQLMTLSSLKSSLFSKEEK